MTNKIPDSAIAQKASELLNEVISQLDNGGEVRTQQDDMVRLVSQAIDTKKPLAVQAGTGCGKSLAYLVSARTTEKPVVVVVSSLSLIDQLTRKDLPFLDRALPSASSWVGVKGLNNYYCKAAAADAERKIEKAAIQDQQGTFLDLKDDSPLSDLVLTNALVSQIDQGESNVEDALPQTQNVRSAEASIDEELRGLFAWSIETKTGDRADLADEPSSQAWAEVSIAPGECPGPVTCTYGESCFAYNPRKQAVSSDIIVVNAHLYGVHLKSGGNILPPHEILICDEVQHFADALIQSTTIEIHQFRFRQLMTAIRRVGGVGYVAIIDQLSDRAETCQQILEELHELVQGATGSSRIYLMQQNDKKLDDEKLSEDGTTADVKNFSELSSSSSSKTDVQVSSKNLNKQAELVQRLEEFLIQCTQDLAKVGEFFRKSKKQSSAPSFVHACEKGTQLSTRLLDEIQEVIATSRLVAWTEKRENAKTNENHYTLKIADIAVDAMLKTQVWDKGVTPIFTSATLPDIIPKQLGLSHCDYHDVGSPFDYKKNALLYVPTNLPLPNDATWQEEANKEVTRLIQAAGGRTLVLCTSLKSLRSVVDHARAQLPSYQILAQGELPKNILVEKFLNESTSVLCAVNSFWTGVDFPGETLTCVICMKLPFPVPSDPIIQARTEAAGDGHQGFYYVSVPAAAVQLAQGVGRLIRTSEDKGVVAVLDTRLAKGNRTAQGFRHRYSYAPKILAALPPMQRVVDSQKAYDFLAQLHSE